MTFNMGQGSRRDGSEELLGEGNQSLPSQGFPVREPCCPVPFSGTDMQATWMLGVLWWVQGLGGHS